MSNIILDIIYLLKDYLLLLSLSTFQLSAYVIDIFNLVCDYLYIILSDFDWFLSIYERYLFFYERRSYRYYTRILWKPSLNISDHLLNVPIFFVLQTMFLVIITVWARAVGPRMRMDQLSQFVWKDFVPSLTLILLVVLIIMLF